jgi:hypothetical protein
MCSFARVMCRFDLYRPTVGQKTQTGPATEQRLKPAVIFVTGGAWVIGCDCFSVVIVVLTLVLFSFLIILLFCLECTKRTLWWLH